MYFNGVNRARRMFTRKPTARMIAEVLAITGTALCIVAETISAPVANPSRPVTPWNSVTNGRIDVTMSPAPAETTSMPKAVFTVPLKIWAPLLRWRARPMRATRARTSAGVIITSMRKLRKGTITPIDASLRERVHGSGQTVCSDVFRERGFDLRDVHDVRYEDGVGKGGELGLKVRRCHDDVGGGSADHACGLVLHFAVDTECLHRLLDRHLQDEARSHSESAYTEDLHICSLVFRVR